MLVVEFEVPGKPQPLGRPRFSRKSRTVYTPQESLNYEYMVYFYAMNAGLKKAGKDDIVKVEVWFLRSDAFRCDLDNLLKAFLDGLRRFFDDRKVMDIYAYKRACEKGYDKTIARIVIEKVEKNGKRRKKK